MGGKAEVRWSSNVFDVHISVNLSENIVLFLPHATI